MTLIQVPQIQQKVSAVNIAGADPGILERGAPIIKSDNEVENGRVHRKGVGAAGARKLWYLYVQNAI